jgi:SAM-dependent methyltransferase
MSQFSTVDDAPDADALVAYLDLTAHGLGAMKRYIVGAHLVAGSRLVLDIGSGAGHDLELLTRAGIGAIGVEPSAAFCGVTAGRLAERDLRATVVRATGESLPLRDGAVDGCRIERVLQHVLDPRAVLREAVRCVRPGGLLTIFEPDWTSLRIASDDLDDDARWLGNVRHPEIGALLPELVADAGADICDVVEEHSVWPTLARAARAGNFAAALARRVRAGTITPAAASAWLDEQRRRDRAGTFRATITKVLVVARVR